MSFNSLIALAWVLAAALPTFWLLKPVMVPTMGKQLFELRRNTWVIATIFVFLTPNFWVFAAAYIVLLMVAMRTEKNPVTLMMVLFYVAPVRSVELPKLGSIALISVDNFTLLTLLLLLPAYLSSRSRKVDKEGFSWTQWAILVFCAIQIVFWMPTETMTHSLRRTVMLTIDTILLFTAIRTLVDTREKLQDALYGLVMAITLMAATAVPEVLKSWQMYMDVAARWNPYSIGSYIIRGGSLRAISATDTPISLGHISACGAIIIFMLREQMADKLQRRHAIFAMLVMCASLYLAKSRAPWVSSAIAISVYLWATPNSSKRLSALLLAVLAGSLTILMTPYGDNLINFLPFVGNLERDNIDYRTNIQAAMWNLMLSNPWSGTPNFLRELDSFRQGQGIVDLLNVYLVWGIGYGIPGFVAFLACMLLSLRTNLKNLRRSKSSNDIQSMYINAGLLAIFIGHAVLMYTMSFVSTVSSLTWLLMAFIASKGAEAPTLRASDARIDRTTQHR